MKKLEFLEIPEKERLGRVLEGVAFFASVHKPNMSSVRKFNGEPYYVVNLGLSEDEANKAKAWGLDVLPPEGQINMPYVKLKRKRSKTKTIEEVKPDVVDTMQNPIPETILIGNGSKVLCKFATYWSDTKPHDGVKAALYKVQVKSLVPYKGGDRDFVSDGSGFVVPAEAMSEDNSTAEDDFEDDLPWSYADEEVTEAPKAAKGGKRTAKATDEFNS